MATKVTARWAFLWMLLLAIFIYHGATTEAFHEVSTYIGIAVGVAIVAAAYLIGRRRARRHSRSNDH